MQAQNTRSDQKPQSILIVEEDEATRRILDLSLRHAGFAVSSLAPGDESQRRLAESPDLLIASADNDGLLLCRQAKQAATHQQAAVLLISSPDVESKRRGLEAGADDFVPRPIYVQEIVARARALLQRRERERIEVSAQASDRFVSAIEDVPLVDLLRTIAANQKSGVALVVDAAGTRGEIFFRQGRVVDAETGRLSGRDAVYRLFCWTSGRLEVEWKSIRRKDTIEMAPQDLLMEALRRVDDWQRLLTALPPLDTIMEVDYRLLAERLADIPDEVNRILRLFDGMRTLMQVIDDCGLPDLDAVAAIGKLCRERIVHDVRVPVDEEEAVGADMEGWLSDAAGPFRAPARVERELFGAGPGSGIGVHGRPTAPLDPLGEGTRDVLDDDMRSRFTDRLQAEGGAPVAPAPGAVADAEAGPDGGAAAGAAAGNGVDEASALGTLAAASEAGGQAVEVPAADSEPSDAARPPRTLPGLGAAAGETRRSPTELPVQAEVVVSPATSAGEEGSSPAALPLLNAPRTASGEIVVRRSAPMKMKPSADAPLPKPARTTAQGRGESDVDVKRLPYMRPSQSSTPPGSARALDELPPFADAAAVVVAANQAEAKGPSEVADQIFSRDEADDELGLSSRRRNMWLAAAAAVILVGGIAAVLRGPSKPSHGPRAVAEGPGAPAPATPPPKIVPLAPPSPVTPPTAGMDKSGSGKPAVTSPVEAVDDRADPKLARMRAAEAGTLLGGCRAAFSEGRMKDAEAACVAAKDANPDSAEAHGLLAHALFNRNRRREALGAAERAVKLNPKWADAYVIIGGVRQDSGDATEAKRAYQRYLELEPHGQYAPDLRAIVGKLEPARL
jgi:CheY-like chemotaxis protein